MWVVFVAILVVSGQVFGLAQRSAGTSNDGRSWERWEVPVFTGRETLSVRVDSSSVNDVNALNGKRVSWDVEVSAFNSNVRLKLVGKHDPEALDLLAQSLVASAV